MIDEEEHSESEFYHPDELQLQDNSNLTETNNVNLEIVILTLLFMCYFKRGNVPTFRQRCLLQGTELNTRVFSLVTSRRQRCRNVGTLPHLTGVLK